MKKLLPVFMPIILIAALFLILADKNDLKPSAQRRAPSPKPQVELDAPSEDDERQPKTIRVAEEEIPKAISVSEDAAASSEMNPPYVGKRYRWKPSKNLTYRHHITFLVGGEVEQDFWPEDQPVRLRWKANNRYSAILGSDQGWAVDVVFAEQYSHFSAYRQSGEEAFDGIISR